MRHLRSNPVTNPPSPNILTINYSADCLFWDKVSPLRVHVDTIFLHAEMYCVTFFCLGTNPWLLACSRVKRKENPCKTGLRWGTWSCLSNRHTRQKSSLLESVLKVINIKQNRTIINLVKFRKGSWQTHIRTSKLGNFIFDSLNLD